MTCIENSLEAMELFCSDEFKPNGQPASPEVSFDHSYFSILFNPLIVLYVIFPGKFCGSPYTDFKANSQMTLRSGPGSMPTFTQTAF